MKNKLEEVPPAAPVDQSIACWVIVVMIEKNDDNGRFPKKRNECIGGFWNLPVELPSHGYHLSKYRYHGYWCGGKEPLSSKGK